MKRTILLSAIFAILAAVVIFVYLSDLESRYKKMAEPIQVVVAVERIAQGSIINQKMITETTIPKEYAQPKVFGSIKTLFTKEGAANYIALNVIEPGEQILATKVSRTNQDTGIANIIPEGKKAITVSIDLESSNVISPGSRVDIMGIIEYADKNKQYQESAYVIVQNILVLAVGDKYLGSVSKKDENREKGLITLSVSVEEAQKILLAQARGSLKYIIRPVGDTEINSIKPLNISEIVKDISKSEPKVITSVSKQNLDNNQKEALALINKYITTGK